MKKNSITINDNKKLLEGFFTVAEAVGKTLGSEGGFAVMHNDFGNPDITKDGISVAKKIFFDDKYKNIGATLAKQVCATTLTKSGDSTTTSLVLAQALVKEMEKRFNKKVQKGVDYAVEDIFKWLDELAEQITDESALKIATISANNNSELGNIVFDAYKAVGNSGIIDVQQHDSASTVLKTFKGMRLDKGYSNPWFITNQNTAQFEAEDVLVVAYEGHLDGDEHIQRFLQDNSNTPILLVAERFSEDVILRLTDFHQRKLLNICAVQAPEFDLKRKAILEDLALYSGGEVFLQGTSTQVVAGKVKKVIVSESDTSIIQDVEDSRVKSRVEELKNQLENVVDKTFIQKRIQNLEGSSATIFVGGITHVERKEKFDLVEDAVSSIKSSLKEGWICGGGASLLYISTLMNRKFDNSDVQFGYDAVKKAILAPFKQICDNANRDYKDYLPSIFTELFRIKTIKKYGYGYNAITDEVSNLIDDGVIDSKYSIKIALENAKSVAVLLLNVKVVIT